MKQKETFRRYEYKYLMTEKQTEVFMAAIGDRLENDAFPVSQIHNLYYDTLDYRLIRTSLEQPVYKEKLRLRSYGEAERVFVELKKKYDGVVYKRRVSAALDEAMRWLDGNAEPPDSQIGREIEAARCRYAALQPRVYLAYDRKSWKGKDNPELRLTFDRNIRYRWENWDIHDDYQTRLLLPENVVLMELKLTDSIPIWMVQVLSELKIYKTSFSKYGLAYQKRSMEHELAISRNF